MDRNHRFHFCVECGHRVLEGCSAATNESRNGIDVADRLLVQTWPEMLFTADRLDACTIVFFGVNSIHAYRFSF